VTNKKVSYQKLNQSLALVTKMKVSFGLRNRPPEWNDCSIGIVILMFGRDLFLEIVILFGIPILLRRGIHVPLKNEMNNYSNRNRLDFPEKTTIIFFLFLME
jgi:hypothetical protein